MLVDYQRDDVVPLAIDGTINSLYALKKVDGRYALFRVKLDGKSGRGPDRGQSQGRHRRRRAHWRWPARVLGYSYAEDRRHTVYFDPNYDQLAKALSKALPNLPLVQFVTASADGNKILLFAGSDFDPWA